MDIDASGHQHLKAWGAPHGLCSHLFINDRTKILVLVFGEINRLSGVTEVSQVVRYF